MSSDIEEIKEALQQRSIKSPIKPEDLLSTGSTLLNLACSGKPFGGFAKGKYYFVVGDSSSGKTWLTLTCMAEASINKNFAGYDFYYDNVEDGALMDIAFYFGEATQKRMRAPSKDEEKQPVYSSTVESFYYHLDSAIARAKAKGRAFIYVLDSQDALTSEAANEKFGEQKEAFQKGKDSAGSYGDGKAKYHSENIRRALVGIRETGSILIIIGQTRDNLGMGFEKKTRSGGRSLRFYATLEMWSSVKEKIKKTVKGKPRTIGILAEIAIKKNRFTGKDRTVRIPIYHSHGIDDVGSCVDYLVEEGHWGQRKGSIVAKDVDFEGSREALIRHIEENDLQRDVAELVGEVWAGIEAACAVPRKPKYL